MGRSRIKRGSKEFDLLDRLKHENRKLKRANDALHKQLSRVDLQKFNNLSNLVDKQRREADAQESISKKEALKKKWLCHQCERDFLKLFIWDHPVKGLVYYRQCSCGHKTRMKPYTDAVEGIKAEEDKE
jgi:hypothetical protein